MDSRPGHALATVGRGPHDAFETGFDNRFEPHQTPIIQILPLSETTAQLTDPSRWTATQAVIFSPTLIGSTRQHMMKGVPSFL